MPTDCQPCLSIFWYLSMCLLTPHPQIRDLGYLHPINHIARIEGVGNWCKERQVGREVWLVPGRGHWGPWEDGWGRRRKLTMVCLCFFQLENFNSWFRGVRTCAHPWTSSPMERGCTLYAVRTSLSATRSRSLPCFWLCLRQQKSPINFMGSIYI